MKKTTIKKAVKKVAKKVIKKKVAEHRILVKGIIESDTRPALWIDVKDSQKLVKWWKSLKGNK